MSNSLSCLINAASARERDLNAPSAIPELIPARMDPCSYSLNGNRLNLVLPAIVNKWTYGGVATALRLFEALSAGFEYARIVLPNQSESEFEFSEWPEWRVDRGDTAAERSVACLDDGASGPLHVAPTDFFLGTFWTTAVYARQALEIQAQLFGRAERRFVYFIQDYEPGFYAWSYRYAYTLSTYTDASVTMAVFNSQLLADFFRRRGFVFSEQYVYEPKLHPRLRERKARSGEVSRERLILVYGRPSVPRNAFELIVEALRLWAGNFAGAHEWTLISAGEEHADIPLAANITLVSAGKLDLDEYARYLSRCWVGLSLMISPHPSYPPLEMAEFGAWTITNGFEGKDLSKWAPNIISIDDLTPSAVAEKLAWCCRQYRPGETAALNEPMPVFKGRHEEFPFAGELVKSWTRPMEERKYGIGR